jgi:peptide/nickel transport system substrate-binding protein
VNGLEGAALAGCRRLAVACLLAVVLLVVAGCGDRQAARQADGVGAPQPGGTVVIGVASEPDVLNSLTRTSAVAGQVLSLMQAGLAEMDEDLQWQPMIAQRWELAPDSLALTFHLRPWRWSDGAPLTAQDVVGSYQLIIDPRVGCPRAGQVDGILGVEALDSATVRYSFARRLARPLDSTVHSLLPWHVVKDLDPGEVSTWALNRSPLASGPFQLESWEHNRQLVLVPNPQYPLQAPWLERVVLRVMPDETARMLALEMGEVDVVTGLNPDAAKRLAGNPEVVVHEVPGRTIAYVLWDLRRSQFKDPRVRRALSLAIDRDRIVAEILQGQAREAASFLPPAMWNHDVDLAPDHRDVEAARRLLAAAGWEDRDGDGVRERDGVRLRFELLARGGSPAFDEVAVLVRENLREVGADVSLRRLELAAMTARLRAGEFDACLVEFSASLWADLSPHVHSRATDRFNFGAYANTKVDSLLVAAVAEPSRERALPLWYRIQEILAIDPPAAVLYYPHSLVGVNARVRGVRTHMLSPYNNLQEWWIAPAERRWRGDH